MSASPSERPQPDPAIRDALRALGVRRMALALHDASLPGDPGEDVGRGAPASRASLRVFDFARACGFDAVQLGPQTLTDEGDASPYTGAVFSREPLSIALGLLADPEAGELGGWLPERRLETLAATRPPDADRRMPYTHVFRTQRAALGAAFETFERRRAAGDPRAEQLEQRLGAFASDAAEWLEPDALYEALRMEHGGRDWMHWQGARAELDLGLGDASRQDPAAQGRRAELARRYAPALRFYRFVQLVAHGQHAHFREALASRGLQVFGDLHIGASARDTWRLRGVFLDGYLLGAPPSRTNPDGQPWGYPVLDPRAYTAADGGPGPALRFVDARMQKMFTEYDAVRVDHPQGLVCPWVYRADAADPLRAVQQGARLFSSPDLPDHPALAPHAIARREQLAADADTPRYADDWVVELDDAQVDRYARVFDRLVDCGRRLGRGDPALICEILSTLPHPLARVLEREGLGRLRVTQKADPADRRDVYRPENAAPRDWVMFGNHDTPPLWHLIEAWGRDGRAAARAAWAAERFEPDPRAREAFRERLIAEPGLLAHAEIAHVFASPAESVSIFFTDLFGLSEIYNRPGLVDPKNWTLRLGSSWREEYAARLREDRALNLPLALWLALRGQAEAAPPDLLRALREQAERARGGSPLP